ncbi:MAG: GNAT family N-acetyltransferase [Chloroflexota bacterium]
MKLTFKPLTAESARQVISWRYPDDYAMYNIEIADDALVEEIAYLTDPPNHYFGIYANSELVGHAVFHAEARVPGGDYSEDALDVGAGMRPDWTGQGKGANIIGAIVEFGIVHYDAKRLRATIAAWNTRAQKATTNNGFQEQSRFTASNSGKEFIIFIRDI